MKIDIRRLLKLLDIQVYKEYHGELWALCPYPNHEETKPSWAIDIDTGKNYCFGCHSGGGALDLVMEVVDLSGYAAARRWVIEHNLDLESTSPLDIKLVFRKKSVKSIELPQGLKTGSLSEWITPARKYMKERGVTNEQIYRWDISYGVVGTLSGRIVLPVYDNNRVLVSYAARTYIDNEVRYRAPDGGGLPGAIFGEQYWPSDKYYKTLVLCEGGFNGLACERAGFRYIGALCGSNFDKEHILKISKFGNIVIASDLDTAGNKLATRLRYILTRWNNVSRVQFPKGLDANDIANKDIRLLRKLINGS